MTTAPLNLDPKPVHILFCTDAAYLQHTAVAVASLLANNAARRFTITVSIDGAAPEATTAIRDMVRGFGNACIRFPVFDPARLAGLPAGRHFTTTMYQRLFAPALYPDKVERVLYLDGDLVVCDDISPLWTAPLEDHPLAGVPDPALPDGEVNSGVLILNLAAWRREDATSRLLGYVRNHATTLEYPDQQALNAVFAGRILKLPSRWNFHAGAAELGATRLGISRAEFADLRRRPGIVHYTTNRKPWLYRKETPFTGLYYRYLGLTPWQNWSPADRTVLTRLSKTVRLMRLKRALRWWRAALR